jgi:hypothetical protein
MPEIFDFTDYVVYGLAGRHHHEPSVTRLSQCSPANGRHMLGSLKWIW